MVQFCSKTDFLFPAGKNEFSLLQIVHTGYWVNPASYSVATGVLSRGYSIRGVKSATQLHLVSRLRSAAILPFSYTPSWHEQGNLYLLHPCPSKKPKILSDTDL